MKKVILNWKRVVKSFQKYPKETIIKSFNDVISLDDRLKEYITLPDKDNIMTTLFNVFKQSIETTNGDKEYFLERIGQMSEISQSLSDYLKDLANNSDAFEDAQGAYECTSKDKPKSWIPIR